ncbi:hypothetical protein GIB67_031512 [Kingdonia uniflora]|uniref:Uncharacterized protein n=1 Tax=Kingdonia uniflora TaxID=39325 RepID=A0A7J7MNE2_9MAGN|nr:hypothetical protein GIB67_031512 [Kingdonia uniflora]
MARRALDGFDQFNGSYTMKNSSGPSNPKLPNCMVVLGFNLLLPNQAFFPIYLYESNFLPCLRDLHGKARK